MKSPFGILDTLGDASRANHDRNYHTQEIIQKNREKMRQTVVHKDLFSLLQSHQQRPPPVEELDQPQLPENPMLRKHQKKRPKSAGVIPIKVMQEVLADNPTLFDHPLMTQPVPVATQPVRTSTFDSLYQTAGSKIAFTFMKKGSNPHNDKQFAEKTQKARSAMQRHIQKRQESALKEASSFSSEMFEEMRAHYQQLLLTIQEANDICQVLGALPHFAPPASAVSAGVSMDDHLLVYEPYVLPSRSLSISEEEAQRLVASTAGGVKLPATYSASLMHVLSCIFLYPQRTLRVKSYLKRKSRRERRAEGVSEAEDDAPSSSITAAAASPPSSSAVRVLTWPIFLAEHQALQEQYCRHSRGESPPANGVTSAPPRPKSAGLGSARASQTPHHRAGGAMSTGNLSMEQVIQNVVQTVTATTTSSSHNNTSSSGSGGGGLHKSVSFIQQPVKSAVRDDEDDDDFVPPPAPNPQAYFDQVDSVQQALHDILADLARRGEDIDMQVAHIVQDKGWNKYAHLH